MFERIKFDRFLSKVFKEIGFSTAQSLEFWPTGATKYFINLNNNSPMKYKPVDAALMALRTITDERLEGGFITKEFADELIAVAENINSDGGGSIWFIKGAKFDWSSR